MNYVVAVTKKIHTTVRCKMVFDKQLLDRIRYDIESEISTYLPYDIELDDLIAVWEESDLVWEKSTDMSERYRKLKETKVTTYGGWETDLAYYIFGSLKCELNDEDHEDILDEIIESKEWDCYWD